MKELNAIDFSKGCYVGQENTARMNLKEKISKRVFLLKSEDNLEIEEDVIFNNEIIGKVISTNPNFAMIKMAKFNDFINQKIETKSSKNILPHWTGEWQVNIYDETNTLLKTLSFSIVETVTEGESQ